MVQKDFTQLILISYLIFGGYSYGEWKERLGILIMVLSVILTITTNTNSIIWGRCNVLLCIKSYKPYSAAFKYASTCK